MINLYLTTVRQKHSSMTHQLVGTRGVGPKPAGWLLRPASRPARNALPAFCVVDNNESQTNRSRRHSASVRFRSILCRRCTGAARCSASDSSQGAPRIRCVYSRGRSAGRWPEEFLVSGRTSHAPPSCLGAWVRPGAGGYRLLPMFSLIRQFHGSLRNSWLRSIDVRRCPFHVLRANASASSRR